jgi:integrase
MHQAAPVTVAKLRWLLGNATAVDADRQAGVVYVCRAYANGRIKRTKTRLSTRAVPPQAKALDALDRLPTSDNPIVFPNMRGGRIDFRIFGRKHWRPAQVKAGIEPVRGLHDLRHTYATFALRAGVPVFAVSRFMGTSIAMIDRSTASPVSASATPSSKGPEPPRKASNCPQDLAPRDRGRRRHLP